MTMVYGPSDDELSAATIRRAHELGVTMFDTAELYGMGPARASSCSGERSRAFATYGSRYAAEHMPEWAAA